MRSRDDPLYFRERAKEEVRRAQRADHPDAARAHYERAGHYLDLVHNRAARSPAQG